MSIEDFEVERRKLQERRREDDQWRDILDNHRDAIEYFIMCNSDLIRYADEMIARGERECQRGGLSANTRRAFDEMSENTEPWAAAVSLIGRAAERYAERIIQMVESRLDVGGVRMLTVNEYEEWNEIMQNRSRRLETFIDSSANLIRALGSIMEIVEGEYQRDGLTGRVGRRLGEMGDDSEYIKRTFDLITTSMSGMMQRVARINLMS